MNSLCKAALLTSFAMPLFAAHQVQPSFSPQAVIVESPNYVFETSFTGLAMQPFANNLSYAAEALPFNYGDAQPAVSPSWVIPEITTDYHFGFILGIAAVFQDAWSNLMLDWQRYHSPTDSSSITAPTVNDMVGTFFEIGPDASAYKQGKGRVTFHFDEVNFDYGTFVRVGQLFRLNLFAGGSFMRLKQNLSTTIANFSETIVRTISIPAQFTGAGPQIGFNFDCNIVKGFRFVGNARTALLVGSFKNKTTYSTSSPDLIALGDQSPNIQTTKVDDHGGVVPAFEGTLGFAYEQPFRCHYLFKIEAGYRAQIYMNAIRSIDMGGEVALAAAGSVGSAATGVYARTFDRTVSDFSLAGPYAAIDFGF